jgi:hypothetical protein
MRPTQGIGCLGLPKAEKPAILLRSIVLAPSRLGASLRLVCASQEETRASIGGVDLRRLTRQLCRLVDSSHTWPGGTGR